MGKKRINVLFVDTVTQRLQEQAMWQRVSVLLTKHYVPGLRRKKLRT